MNYIVYGQEKYPLSDALVLCGNERERYLLPAEAFALEGIDALAAFLVEGRDRCFLVSDATQDVRVNNTPVRGGLQALRDGDCVEIAGSVFTVRATHEAQQGVWEQHAGDAPRCPVCRATLREGDAVTWCGRCRTPHHRRCFQARAGRCGVYGCLHVHGGDGS